MQKLLANVSGLQKLANGKKIGFRTFVKMEDGHRQ